MNTPASEIARGEPKRTVRSCGPGAAGAASLAMTRGGCGAAVKPTAGTRTRNMNSRWITVARRFMVRLHRVVTQGARIRVLALLQHYHRQPAPGRLARVSIAERPLLTPIQLPIPRRGSWIPV